MAAVTLSDTPVLVLGGTGHYGRHIVCSLLNKGEPVRVLSRNEARARKVLGGGAEIVEGDITSEAAVAEALQGAQAVVVSVSAFSPKLIKKLKLIECDSVLMVLEQLHEAALSRVVYISIYDIDTGVVEELDLEAGRHKLEVEAALARSHLNWTVLGAAPSMAIFFSMIRGNRMMVPGGGSAALATISDVDVGEIAAQAALRDDLGGQRLRMVGPEGISFPNAARRISAATGRELRFVKIPLLPLQIASVVAAPFNPFLRHLLPMVKLMNRFPQDIVADIPRDHQRLLETFDYVPTTLEMEALKWMREQRSVLNNS